MLELDPHPVFDALVREFALNGMAIEVPRRPSPTPRHRLPEVDE